MRRRHSFGRGFPTAAGQAIKKTLLNISTAPFRFPGILIGIGNSTESEHVQFKPGSTDLLPDQKEELANLQKVLRERPGITLEIHGACDRVFDKRALQKNKFDTLYNSGLGNGGTDSTPGQYLSREVLERLYRELLSDSSLISVQKSFGIGIKEQGVNHTDHRESCTVLNDDLIAAMPVTESELNRMAETRAEIIRNNLTRMQRLPENRFKMSKIEILNTQQ